MRKWISESDKKPCKRFIIEEEEGIGFYLYVFDGEKCIKDCLQDTLDFAIEQANEDFGVNRASWKLLNDKET
jgi:hypothetical protein